MRKSLGKAPRSKSSRKGRGRASEADLDLHELEAQHDRLKSDWMSLAVQLGIGGPDDKAFD